MKRILIVVDMQTDFVDGALGTPEAVAIVPYVKDRIQGFDGKRFYERHAHIVKKKKRGRPSEKQEDASENEKKSQKN